MLQWLDFGARNRFSDKGCHPFYEFPFDSAKVYIFLQICKILRGFVNSHYMPIFAFGYHNRSGKKA